jgi:hypothetical protein
MARAFRPTASTASTVSAALFVWDTQVRATSAPSSAKRWTIAAPIPRDPPKTIATFPSNLRFSPMTISIID